MKKIITCIIILLVTSTSLFSRQWQNDQDYKFAFTRCDGIFKEGNSIQEVIVIPVISIYQEHHIPEILCSFLIYLEDGTNIKIEKSFFFDFDKNNIWLTNEKNESIKIYDSNDIAGFFYSIFNASAIKYINFLKSAESVNVKVKNEDLELSFFLDTEGLINAYRAIVLNAVVDPSSFSKWTMSERDKMNSKYIILPNLKDRKLLELTVISNKSSKLPPTLKFHVSDMDKTGFYYEFNDITKLVVSTNSNSYTINFSPSLSAADYELDRMKNILRNQQTASLKLYNNSELVFQSELNAKEFIDVLSYN